MIRKVTCGLLTFIATMLFLCVLMATCSGCKKTTQTNLTTENISVKYVFQSNSTCKMVIAYANSGRDTVSANYYTITVNSTVYQNKPLNLNSADVLINDVNPNDTCKTFIYLNGTLVGSNFIGTQSNRYSASSSYNK